MERLYFSYNHQSLINEYANPYVIFGYMLLLSTTLLNVFAFSKGIKYKNGPVIETLGFILVMMLSKLFFRRGLPGARPWVTC